MATKLNCFDSGKESRCRESVSRKPYQDKPGPYRERPDSGRSMLITIATQHYTMLARNLVYTAVLPNTWERGSP
jgi:hypothetical protein